LLKYMLVWQKKSLYYECIDILLVRADLDAKLA